MLTSHIYRIPASFVYCWCIDYVFFSCVVVGFCLCVVGVESDSEGEGEAEREGRG